MQTPIDFGKNFLNSFFSSRDPELCLEDMAYDVVWITPKQMYHFLSAKEIRDFLQEEMTARLSPKNWRNGSARPPISPS